MHLLEFCSGVFLIVFLPPLASSEKGKTPSTDFYVQLSREPFDIRDGRVGDS